jgi:cytochrome c biogenesis protein CcmG/thiol:disulfide interchange protein DsbE
MAMRQSQKARRPQAQPPLPVVVAALAAAVVAGAVAMGLWLRPASRPVRAPSLPVPTGPQVGRPAPAFAVPGLTGGRLTLARYAGHPRVVSFFAAWCEECWNDMSDLERAYERYRRQGLVMIGIGVQDTVADLRQMAANVGVSFPLGYDQSGDLAARAYHLYSIPTTVFIGADGTIKAELQGRVFSDALQRYLALILPAAAQ